MPEWVVALTASLIGASTGWVTTFFTRRANIEAKMSRFEKQNRAQWFYIQQLIKHINDQEPPPPPTPPKSVIEMESL